MSKNKNAHFFQLPKDALSRINLGQSFAEYDRLLEHSGIFVVTPAIQSALDPSRSKCFFVGRRGTGKTAITCYLKNKKQHVIQIHPQVFTSFSTMSESIDFSDTRQRPVQSLVAGFRRALIDEVIHYAIRHRIRRVDDFGPNVVSERNYIEDHDFDTRFVTFAEEAFEYLTMPNPKNEKNWLRYMNKPKALSHSLSEEFAGHLEVMVLIDRIDDTWDGSNTAVLLLMALMHACIEVGASTKCVRPMLFVRENIFERVRQIDNEFLRLETCVVSLDWTEPLLTELVERRLQLPLNPKPKIGETWDYLFEQASGQSSRDLVFTYCQHRPRDILTYCTIAIESAQSQRSPLVRLEDLQEARRRFSESRLKDLGDEYSENFPQIALVLSRFYGLATSYTMHAVEGLIQRMLVDEEVKACCGTWIYHYTAPHRFVELLYGIGFWGISDGGDPIFRGVGVRSASLPALTGASSVIIHPSYVDALNLQQKILGSFNDVGPLQKEGLLLDLPDAIDVNEYQSRLQILMDEVDTIPMGQSGASAFEDLIGELISLCFFRVLVNPEARKRDVDGRVIRDWITSNVASHGFWEMVRQRYNATQIIWECKNYMDLDASAFQQVAYYMNDHIGSFVVLCFRGEDRSKKEYIQHIRRISTDKKGMVLLLVEKDIKVFLRQALRGKVKDSHIRGIYDEIVRGIS